MLDIIKSNIVYGGKLETQRNCALWEEIVHQAQ